MPITIATNRLYTLSLGNQRLARLAAEQDINKATEMGWIDQIKDWFASGEKKNTLTLLHKLLHQATSVTGTEKERLNSIFEKASVRDLISFWQAKDENGCPMLRHAMRTGDITTIKQFQSLLDIFPLSDFSADELLAMLEGHTAVELALLNNKSAAVREYVSLLKLIMEEVRTYPFFSPAMHEEIMKSVFCNSRVIAAVRLAFSDPLQINATKDFLEMIKVSDEPSLHREFCHIVRQMLTSSEGFKFLSNVKSALGDNGSQAVVDLLHSLLIFPDRHASQDLVNSFVLADRDWLEVIYVSESMTEVEVHARFDTFDRYTAFLDGLSLNVWEDTWKYDDPDRLQPLGYFIRSAFKLKRYDTANSLLKLVDRAAPAYSYPTILSNITRDLLTISDWTGLKVLLRSVGNGAARKAVLETLSGDRNKLGGLWSQLTISRDWELIDKVLAYSMPGGQLEYLTDELLEKISADEDALAAMMQYRLDRDGWQGITQLWDRATPTQKTRLSQIILSNMRGFSSWLKTAPTRSLHGRIVFELIKASPERYLDQLLKTILSKPLALSASFYFDHLNDELSNESLLTVVSQLTVDDGLKKRLMGTIAEAINQLPDATKTRLAYSVLSIWMAYDTYLEHPEVLEFVEFTLRLTIRAGNERQLVATAKQLELLVEYLIKQNVSRQYYYMLNYNGFFIQLMALCTHHEKPNTRKGAAELYDQYLKLDAVRPHAAYLREYYDQADGIRSRSSAEDLEEVADPETRATARPLLASDPFYIFICDKPKQEKSGPFCYAVLLSKNDLAGIFDKEDYEWPLNTFTDALESDSRDEIAVKLNGVAVADTYLQFPIFAKRYADIVSTRLFRKLFQIIDLNYIATSSDQVSHDYSDQFIRALSVNRTYTPKLTSDDDRVRLNAIFDRYLVRPESQDWTPEIVPAIRDDHLKEIYALYELEIEPDTEQDKIKAAQMLFCLATLFCKFSSKSVFGKEDESPLAIRFYAGALLKQAYELAPNMIGDERYGGFRNSLYGFEDAETCTNMLTEAMGNYIRAHSPEFRSTLAKIKPVAWNL